MVGKAGTFDKLTAALQVDSTETLKTLGWSPPVSMKEGLRETARWFAEARSGSAKEAPGGRAE